MTNAPALPICYAIEADDVDMDYAVRAEIIIALSELI